MTNTPSLSISFGTSGLRGPETGFTAKNINAYIGAFLFVVAKSTSNKTLYVGQDLRASSPRIASDCLAAIKASGWQAVYAGQVPTPALADYALKHQSPAIMITGSHIPEDYNGIKFYRPDGELMKADEAPIQQEAMRRLSIETALEPTPLPEPDNAIERAYVARYSNAFSPQSLTGMRIGVDLHSAVGRDLLVEILEKLGATCFPFRRSENFIAVDTEAVDPKDMQRAEMQLAKNQLDAIVSTDGDGDRPLLIDDLGNQINGDVMGALTAKALNIDIVVTPLSSTSAIEKSHWFKKVIRTRIGSPYVVAAMAEQAAPNTTIAGFEANGGFLLETDIKTPKGTLSRLPTRDALLPLLTVLMAANEQQITLSQLANTLPPRFMKADRLKNIAPEMGSAFLNAMATSAKARSKLDQRLCAPAEIDLLDGVRLTFNDETIVHFRQSGNAPELRCYIETDALASTQTYLREIMTAMNQFLAAQDNV